MHTVFFSRDESLRQGWRIALFILALAAALFLLGGLESLLGRPAWMQNTWPGVGVLLGLSAGALRLEHRPLANLGLRLNGRFGMEFLLGCLMGAALLGAAALALHLAGGVTFQRTPGVGLSRLLWSAWFLLGVSLFEELLFRGYLFQRLAEGMGLWPALLLGGAFFAVAHWGNPGMSGGVKVWATLNIALAAVLLGLCWARTRSLALPFGVHLTWNWTQGSLLGFGVSGTHAKGLLTPVLADKPTWLTGGPFGLEASLPGCAVLVIAVVALALWKGRQEAI